MSYYGTDWIDRLFIWALIAVTALFAGLIVFFVAEYATSWKEKVYVTVLDTYYEAPRSGTGVGVTGNGGTAVVVTSSSAKYNILLEFQDGTREIVETDERTILYSNVGEQLEMDCRFGGITKEILSCSR